MTGTLTIAGLGPGDAALVTPEVSAALAEATDVLGYAPYVARVPPREGLRPPARRGREAGAAPDSRERRCLRPLTPDGPDR